MTGFVPYVPPPPAEQLSFLPFLRAVRSNALDMFTAAAYTQPVVTRRQIGRTTMVLNTPEAIQHVLMTNEANYARTPAGRRILGPIIGNGLLLSEGDAWRHQRRTIAPALAPRVMPVLAGHITAATNEAVAQLARQPGERVDLLSAMQFLSLEIAGRSMFSLEMRAKGQRMRQMLLQYAHRLARPYMLDMLLPPNIPSPHDFFRRRFRDHWMAFVDEVMAPRMAAPPADPPRDMFDMLRLARDPETGQGFSRAELRDQTATMIIAGHETTGLTLFWGLWLLAQVPQVQARVAAEAEAANLTPQTAGAALARLPYTRAVVNEVLRLYPPAFTIVRMAKAADRVGETDIPAGATVMISPWVLHRHRTLWQNPEAFDPERFMGAAPPRFSYLPFGIGPRVCVGAQFALAEAVLGLAGIVSRFDVSLLQGQRVVPRPVITTAPDHAPLFRLVQRAEARAAA
jgi:cytochrome P450